jgi:hypothetical protein
MNDHWIFDFSKLELGDLQAFANAPNSPINEFMHLVGKAVVAGPVRIDWQDRYGWAQLTLLEFNAFMQQADTSLRAFLGSLRNSES